MLEKPNSKTNLANPLLSVIIPCYTINRLNDVINLIYSIKAQTYSNVEIIIVSDSSHLYDKLSSRLMKSVYSCIRLVYNEGAKGTSSAKNLGIMYANGDIISFVDDDVILYPSWAEKIIKTFQEDDSIIGVTGPALPMWEGEPATWFPDEFSWILGYTAWHKWAEMRDVENVWGMNMAFKREAFDRCGLFQTKIGFEGGFRKCWRRVGSEENELSLRVRERTGRRIIYNPYVRVKHKVYKCRLAPTYVAKRAYHIGLNRATMRRLYSRSMNTITSPSPEYILLKRIFLKLFPEIIRLFFKHPVIAMRKLLVTLIVLPCVTLGYCSYHKNPLASTY